jgi:hypothetical protein
MALMSIPGHLAQDCFGSLDIDILGLHEFTESAEMERVMDASYSA